VAGLRASVALPEVDGVKVRLVVYVESPDVSPELSAPKPAAYKVTFPTFVAGGVQSTA
jgi:hypothetical protein